MSDRPRILVTEKIAEGGIEVLRQIGDVDVELEWSKEDLADRIAPYDALVVRSATKVTAQLIERAENLRVVGRAGTGVDNVDVEAATDRGIIVVNAAGSNAVSAAEHAIALLLAQARNIPQAHMSLVAGKWERAKFGGIEVTGKTLGVIGFGNIGQMVAERALGLCMRVVAYDPFVAEARYREMGVQKAETLEEIYGASDFITIHVASTPETRGFINAEAIEAMKPGVRIINDARGDLIDEAALVAGVLSGKVGKCERSGSRLKHFLLELSAPLRWGCIVLRFVYLMLRLEVRLGGRPALWLPAQACDARRPALSPPPLPNTILRFLQSVGRW